MNPTSNGRWGRYKQIKGETYKLCNGPAHGEDGEYVPLSKYWTYKKGPRQGKPLSRCMDCERVTRGRTESGFVPIERVSFALKEVEFRLGRAEACRRLGVSQNFWCRLDNRVYKNMRYATAKRLLLLLKELREKNVVRHKKSIRHGAAIRGHKEKIPKKKNDFYYANDDNVNEHKRDWRSKNRVDVV